jgi:hypothetical protein
MSRHGYFDEEDYQGQFALYAQRVRNAARGKRGQAWLRELLAALDAMPKKELAAHTVASRGECCAVGALAIHRGIDLTEITYDDPDDEFYDGEETTEWLAAHFDVADCLLRDVVYENDEGGKWDETPAQRWERMRALVARLVKEEQKP